MQFKSRFVAAVSEKYIWTTPCCGYVMLCYVAVMYIWTTPCSPTRGGLKGYGLRKEEDVLLYNILHQITEDKPFHRPTYSEVSP